MKAECSFSCSRALVTDLHPEPDESYPHPHILLF